jgi:hypothetical protein
MLFLKGSLFVFMVLLVTVRTIPKFRVFAESVLYAWSWSTGNFLGWNKCLCGMMLAKLTLAELPRVERAVIKCVPYFSTALALSFPDEYYDLAPWSRQLLKLVGTTTILS